MKDLPLVGGSGIESLPRSLSLRCDVRLETIEGVLALAQEWAGERGLGGDDKAGLRLLLEELLLNIRFHAANGGKARDPGDFFVDLHLEFVFPYSGPHSASGGPPPDRLRIMLADSGEPFDPLRHNAEEPAATLGSAAPGGRGLALVRLFSVNRRYRREDGRNILSLDMPLEAVSGSAAGSGRAGGGRPATGLRHTLRGVWRKKLALRQTVLFTVSAAVLLWSGASIYYAGVADMRAENAAYLSMESLATQDELSRAFLRRVEGGLALFTRSIAAHPQAQGLLNNPDAFLTVLRQGDFFRPFITETPVIGITLSGGDEAGGLLFHQPDGEIVKSRLPELPAGEDAPEGPREGAGDGPDVPRTAGPHWQGPVFHVPDPKVGRHAAMYFSLPVEIPGRMPGAAGEYRLGVIIGMPWIEVALRRLSGFEQCVPVFTNGWGEYVLYPPGRSAESGPQSLREDAAAHHLPGMATLARRMADSGEGGLMHFSEGLETSPGNPVWPLPWKDSSSLAYRPLSLPGWRLAMIVPDKALGNTLPPPPYWLILLGILGPVLLGAAAWVTTSRTLRPLRDLAAALENLGEGDLDTPFPEPRIDDEIGRMLDAFERTRIIVKASIRSQVRGAAAQQRLRNELTLARTIQESMLPEVFPAAPGVDIAAHVDMARDVCGDLYDCFAPDPARPDLVACVIGDVCGKGIPAALIMSRAVPLARAALQEGLPPAPALERVNAALLRQDNRSMFITMLIGIFDASQGLFTWACAGHPPPMPGPVPGPAPEAPAWSNELVLGVRPWTYTERGIRLLPGQSLLLYTDGADEAMGPGPGGGAPASGSTEGLCLYGEERLAASFAAACRAGETTGAPSAGAILENVRGDILAHMAGMPPFDDISLMVLRRTGPAVAP